MTVVVGKRREVAVAVGITNNCECEFMFTGMGRKRRGHEIIMVTAIEKNPRSILDDSLNVGDVPHLVVLFRHNSGHRQGLEKGLHSGHWLC